MDYKDLTKICSKEKIKYSIAIIDFPPLLVIMEFNSVFICTAIFFFIIFHNNSQMFSELVIYGINRRQGLTREKIF